MGLIYLLPHEKNPNDDRVIITDQSIELKSYGLPTIFWWYLLAILSVLIIMWIAAHDLIDKLITYPDDISLNLLGHLVRLTFFLSPTVLLAFFFYEKSLKKSKAHLEIQYRLFFLPIWKKKINLKDSQSFFVEHYLSSPNMVRIKNQANFGLNNDSLRAFENKGYFELYVETKNGDKICIDRHTRKIDLQNIQKILSEY